MILFFYSWFMVEIKTGLIALVIDVLIELIRRRLKRRKVEVTSDEA